MKALLPGCSLAEALTVLLMSFNILRMLSAYMGIFEISSRCLRQGGAGWNRCQHIQTVLHELSTVNRRTPVLFPTTQKANPRYDTGTPIGRSAVREGRRHHSCTCTCTCDRAKEAATARVFAPLQCNKRRTQTGTMTRNADESPRMTRFSSLFVSTAVFHLLYACSLGETARTRIHGEAMGTCDDAIVARAYQLWHK